MKGNSPREVAFYISLVTVLVVSIIYSGLQLFQDGEVKWIPNIITGFIAFGILYFVALGAIERFIHQKIRIIYRTIHRLKTQRTEEALDLSEDVLEKVNQEVQEWADGRKDEIDRLKVQEAFRREFIGNLAHELKTPLFNVQGYLFTLLEGGLEDESINYDYLKRADRNLERLIDLVEDLDNISRLESKPDLLELAKINLLDVVEEVFGSLELNAKKRGIQLVFNKVYDKPIWVNADRKKINQVLTNLIANSINYGKDSGKTEVRFYDMDTNILIEISDDGLGISPEHLPRLFERFYRVDKSRARNQGGTGLGLAIVKHIIDAHKQSIDVRSEKGKGSTFSFTLTKAR